MDTPHRSRALVSGVYLDAGEVLDVGQADGLHARVIRAFERTDHEVVLMCSDLRFVDSSGLRVLLELEREAQLRGVRLVLGDPSRRLRELLALTGLMNVLDIDDDAHTPVVAGTPIGGFPVANLVGTRVE